MKGVHTPSTQKGKKITTHLHILHLELGVNIVFVYIPSSHLHLH
jgi:hypothetical protein